MPGQKSERLMPQFDPASTVAGSTQAGNTPGTKGTAVIVSTRGRPNIVASLVQQLGEQTRPPEAIFESRPDVAGLTGAVLADGTRTAGIRLNDAKSMVSLYDASPSLGGVLHERFSYGSNVGCNMAYRYSAMHDITFDERLPLYAWHEDSDFRGQVERRGLFVRAEALWGVHLGHKQGRGRGVTLGYSQIANPVYLGMK